MEESNFIKFSIVYHHTLSIIAILSGIIMTFVEQYNATASILNSLMLITIIWSLGTFCFLLLPLFCLAMLAIVKYLPVISPIVWIYHIIAYFYNEVTIIDEIGMLNFSLICLALTIFGLFNIVTRGTFDSDITF